MKWESDSLPPQFGVNPDISVPAGASLPHKLWVTLNQLRTGGGRFGASMHRWGLSDSASCMCGAPEQMAEHIVYDCQVLHPPSGAQDLSTPDQALQEWLSGLSAIT